MNYEKFKNKESFEDFDVIEFLEGQNPEVNARGQTHYTLDRNSSFFLLRSHTFKLTDSIKDEVSEICYQIRQDNGVLTQPLILPVVIDVEKREIIQGAVWLMVNQYQRTPRKIWVELKV